MTIISIKIWCAIIWAVVQYDISIGTQIDESLTRESSTSENVKTPSPQNDLTQALSEACKELEDETADEKERREYRNLWRVIADQRYKDYE